MSTSLVVRSAFILAAVTALSAGAAFAQNEFPANRVYAPVSTPPPPPEPHAWLPGDTTPAAPPPQILAPAMAALKSANVQCTPLEVAAHKDAIIGGGKHAKIYEASCQEGLGYLAIAPASGPATAVDCLAQAAANGDHPPANALACVLGSNNPASQMSRLVVGQADACHPTAARYVGSNPATGVSYYETACTAGPGFMLAVKAGKLVRPFPCAQATQVGGGCTLPPGPLTP